MTSQSVLHIGALPPPVGGVTIHCERVLAAMRAQGIEAFVANPRRRAGQHRDEHDGLDGWRLIARAWRQRWPVFLHFSASTEIVRTTMLAAIAMLVRPSRLILVQHSGAFPSVLQSPGVAAALHRLLVKRARVALCLSASIQEAVLDVSPEITTVRAASFIAGDEIERIKLGSSEAADAPRRVITSGYRTDTYRYHELLEVWGRIHPDYPDAELHLYVYGETDAAYWGRIERILVDSVNVRVFDETGSERFLEALAEACLYVRNTSHDSYGVAVAEALYLGTPAAATTVCARPGGAVVYDVGDLGTMEDLVRAALEDSLGTNGSWGDDGMTGYIDTLTSLGLTGDDAAKGPTPRR